MSDHADKINRRSAHITEGVARAPNRSMYYALGYQEGDFKKPMIGVANGHSTITPCNSGLQRLADAAVIGLKEAGANPQIFGTPTISDGMAMGTEGMKYSLVSREVIADCIETCVQGPATHMLTGPVHVEGAMPGDVLQIDIERLPGLFERIGDVLATLLMEYPGPVRLFLQESRAPAQGARRPIIDLSKTVSRYAIEMTKTAQKHGILKPIPVAVSALTVVAKASLFSLAIAPKPCSVHKAWMAAVFRPMSSTRRSVISASSAGTTSLLARSTSRRWPWRRQRRLSLLNAARS